MSDLLRKKTMPLPVIILLATAVLTIVAALVWAFSNPSADDSTPPWQVAIDNLQYAVQSEQDARQALSQGLEGLRVSLHETMAKVDSQQAQQQVLAETLQAVRQLAVSAEQATVGHEESLKTLRSQLAVLELRIHEQMAVKPASVPSVAAKSVAARPNAKPQPLVPPFRVMDVEYRGGEPFLMIAPKNSHSLADIRFLREGDSLSGWQLARLSPQQAVFAVGNRRHAVELQPVLSMN